MKDLIKKILSEETEFGKEYAERKEYAKKVLPNIMSMIEDKYFDYPNVDSATLSERSIMYGSDSHQDTYYLLRLVFFDVNENTKRKLKKEIIDDVRKLYGLDITEYACPLDIQFYSLEEKEF
jgi:hypothetical protein